MKTKLEKWHERTRQKYTQVIEEVIKMTSKAPRTGTELVNYYKAREIGNQVTQAMLDAGLLTFVKDGKRKIYSPTEKALKKRYRMKCLLDRHFEKRNNVNKEARKNREAKKKPAPAPSRPVSKQLPLFELTLENSQRLTWDEWVKKAKADGYTITKSL